MSFIRIKKVKDWKYAYLVENTWKSKKTKQKVKQYLGRVHFLENIVGLEFDRNIEKMSFEEAVKELVKFELMKNGFKESGSCLKKGKFVVNFDECTFLNSKKPAVFESNEGFICSCTFNKIINFKPSKNEDDTALRFAEAVLEAGISIPHNVFVKLFEKLHKPTMPVIEDGQRFINEA